MSDTGSPEPVVYKYAGNTCLPGRLTSTLKFSSPFQTLQHGLASGDCRLDIKDESSNQKLTDRLLVEMCMGIKPMCIKFKPSVKSLVQIMALTWTKINLNEIASKQKWTYDSG